MTRVLPEHAALCADFMLDQEPADIVAPLYVLNALDAIETIRARGADGLLRPESFYLEEFRKSLERWLNSDRRACVAMLGPGLGISQEEL